MKKGRLEAFSDGVLAIVITIMVLEMKAPENTSLGALVPVIPVFGSYLISFIYVGMYWINHHNILAPVSTINWQILWANMHFLFWLSLVPFTTSWIGENHIEPIPVILYGIVLFLCSLAYKVLEFTLVRYNREAFCESEVRMMNRKEYVTLALNLAAILLAFAHVYISIAMYVLVAILWVIPDSFNFLDRNDARHCTPPKIENGKLENESD